MSMGSCSVCGEAVTDERPNYMVVLEAEDVARSAESAEASTSPTMEYCLDRQLCVDCWQDLYERLSTS